ncbi:class I SAM-dependent methyltransferase [Ferruginibacter sp. SUN106]|uniref:class I SAM-dependent methyltransferase n=1 Tax=Ferruginibacter sp. SUN106 TaxID=2978348 RepID=UPI003D369B23
MSNQLSSFLQKISESFNQQQLVKITLGNKRDKSADLKNVFIKPVRIKNTEKLSFTYRNPTQDIFKNYDLKESLILIEKMLQTDFYNADLFTAVNDLHLAIDKNDITKIITKPATLSITATTQQHDKQKVRVVNSTTAVYLHQLGITTAEGQVKKDMQDKFKQINRYVEIIEGIIKDIQFEKNITVADMGSGKGYLTFALYDYLINTLKKDATIVGIEMRDDLVNKCNQIAKNIHYSNLKFEKGTIQDAEVPAINMLIALHACDTATDDAIFKGIQANAEVIICAPCCHKQIRKQMAPENELKSITRHGILLERQAEIVTDSIRALILEAHGYKTKVFEFIATEHTPKNVLIVATKTNKTETAKQESLEKVAGLKKLFNIKTHYLETLL